MQRYFGTRNNDKTFNLINDDIYHILKVMRMKTNDKIEVICDEKLYLCTLEIKEEHIIIKEEKLLDIYHKDKLEVTLLLPLLKEQKMDFVLQKSTELGISKIIPIKTSRSIVAIDKKREAKKLERWMKIVKEASEQSKRFDIPVIMPIVDIKDLKNIEGTKLVLSVVEKNNNLKKALLNINNYDKLVIAVGPEGGLSQDEEDFLVNIGFSRVSLGKRILRVETVPLVVLSIINYENME